MKAIQIKNGAPTFAESALPTEEGVRVKVVSSSIFGTDFTLLKHGFLGEALIPGHEIAGYTPDGKAVAVEPFHKCGHCVPCEQGLPAHCRQGDLPSVVGITRNGGMAEFVNVPESMLVELPSGLNIGIANLVEPLAVAVRGLRRAEVTNKDKVLIIGAGAIGLAAAACLQAWGVACAIQARYPHQQQAADKLGAGQNIDQDYTLVIDGVGNSASLAEAVQCASYCGRILMLGSPFEPLPMPPGVCQKELSFIPSTAYKCSEPDRDFFEAAKILFANAHIADAMITHRFPLEGAKEAFAAAADKTSGAVKVCFEIA